MAEPTHIENDDMRIDIEAVESIEIFSLNEVPEKPRKATARFTVSLNPHVVITRKVLIYSDGRVYLDG